MRKLTDEQKAWLSSPMANTLRAHYQAQQKLTLSALLGAAGTSTDPKIQGFALSYMTWKEALRSLEIEDGSDN